MVMMDRKSLPAPGRVRVILPFYSRPLGKAVTAPTLDSLHFQTTGLTRHFQKIKCHPTGKLEKPEKLDTLIHGPGMMSSNNLCSQLGAALIFGQWGVVNTTYWLTKAKWNMLSPVFFCQPLSCCLTGPCSNSLRRKKRWIMQLLCKSSPDASTTTQISAFFQSNLTKPW